MFVVLYLKSEMKQLNKERERKQKLSAREADLAEFSTLPFSKAQLKNHLAISKGVRAVTNLANGTKIPNPPPLSESNITCVILR